VQHNIAAQIENPRDIVEPRALGSSDAMRRATVMDAYEKGAPTAATKNADQSVAVSDVGH
jgi:pilus assembly protein CpaD